MTPTLSSTVRCYPGWVMSGVILSQDDGFAVVFSDVMVDCTQGMDTCVWELCSN